MHEKIGRNDLCPCGSGKKYKQCCLAKQLAPAVSPKKHEGAVKRAVQWLYERHRKAMQAAMDELLDFLVNEEVRSFFYDAVNEKDWAQIQLNLTEWLLAEGEILVKGTMRRVSDVLLGPGGPPFTVEQRAWLQEMATQPLRLYDVTDVVPGAQITLSDILDPDALPIVVHGHLASQILTPGSMLGCRIMRVDEHFEFSGIAYLFSPDYSPVVAAELRAFMEEELAQAQDAADAEMPRSPGISISIMAAWILQYITPLQMPDELMDAYSQEPILLITDYYQVGNWQALADALAACPDVQGDRNGGWDRVIDSADGETRSVTSISLEQEADRISVFYKTQRYADEGRAWFESVIGEAATFLTRETLGDFRK